MLRSADQRGHKVYSLHAPEVECIGKGKAHKPYEFGVKVSVATTLKHCKGGQFVTHVQALPGNPYDGHTLARVIPAMEQLIGNTIERLHADAGYRGHNAPPDYKFKIYTSKQKRRVTPQIKREMRRRSAVEPVIGHLKAEHRMDRNYLAFREGDANNAILAAVGYNFRRLIRWLRILWCLILTLILASQNRRRRERSILHSRQIQLEAAQRAAIVTAVRDADSSYGLQDKSILSDIALDNVCAGQLKHDPQCRDSERDREERQQYLDSSCPNFLPDPCRSRIGPVTKCRRIRKPPRSHVERLWIVAPSRWRAAAPRV